MWLEKGKISRHDVLRREGRGGEGRGGEGRGGEGRGGEGRGGRGSADGENGKHRTKWIAQSYTVMRSSSLDCEGNGKACLRQPLLHSSNVPSVRPDNIQIPCLRVLLG